MYIYRILSNYKCKEETQVLKEGQKGHVTVYLDAFCYGVLCNVCVDDLCHRCITEVPWSH